MMVRRCAWKIEVFRCFALDDFNPDSLDSCVKMSCYIVGVCVREDQSDFRASPLNESAAGLVLL